MPEPLAKVGGGDLVSIVSSSEQNFVNATFGAELLAETPLGPVSNGGFFWLGYTDSLSEGLWVWAEGSMSSFSHWLSGCGEPTNTNFGADDCASQYQNKTSEPCGGVWGWGANTCATSFHMYICESSE